MRNKLYALLLQAILPCMLFAQVENYSFTKMAPCPEGAYAPVTFTIGDSIYVMGGVLGNFLNPPLHLTQHVWLYNVATNTWTQQGDFPGLATYQGSAFVLNGYGYIVNGFDSTESGNPAGSELWQYNPQTDTWVTKASFPGSARYCTSSFALNNKGYVGLGYSPLQNDLWEYDPTADAWTQKSNYPGAARQTAVTFVVNNTAYVGFGDIDIPGGYYLPSDIYSYNGTTDTWTQLGIFPGPPFLSSYVVVINNEVFTICGSDEGSVNLHLSAGSPNVWKYVPATDTWTWWGMFPDTAITAGISGSVNGQGYLGLGDNNALTYNLTHSFWRFGPGVGTTSCNATIDTGFINNATRNFVASGNFSSTAVISWNFGDGTAGTGVSVNHAYDSVGTYTVVLTVTDTANGGCNFNASVVVNIIGLSNCTVALSSTNINADYTLYANPTGFGPYTYYWTNVSGVLISNSPDPLVYLPAGDTATYCLTIIDSTGCSASACQTFVGAPDTAVSCQTYLYIYPDPNVPGLYYGYVYHTGATPVSYVWSFGDGTLDSIPGDSIVNYTYSNFGFYDICLTITDAANCTSSYCDSVFYAYKVGGGPMDKFQEVTTPPTAITGISNTKGELLLSVYPNPTNDRLSIVANQQIDYLAVYTTLGQKVKEQEAPENNTIDVAQLAAGVYFVDVHIGTSSGRVKFVKEN